MRAARESKGRWLLVPALVLVALAVALVAPAQEGAPAVPAATLAPAGGQTTVEAAATAPAAAVVIAASATREAPFERSLPAPLRRDSFLDLRVWQWLALPLLLVVAFIVAALATAIVRRLLLPAVSRTETSVDDAVVKSARGPLLFAFTVMFVAAGLPMLALAEPVHVFLRGLLKGFGVIALAWAALRMTDVAAVGMARRFEREGRRRLAALVPLGRRSAKVFLAIIAVVVLLQNVGLDVTGLIAGLGVGGIAVALAAQKTIENVFGGISVIADQPVNVGDLCRFRDGATGTVEEIGLRSTRIRTPERSLVSIPNADFAQRELENLTARDRIRLFTVLRLRYDTTPEQVRAVLAGLRELIASHPMVSAEKRDIYFIGFGQGSLDVEVSAYVRTTSPDQFSAVREDLFLRMIDTVEQCGTALARPVTVATVPSTPAAPKAS